MMHNCLVTKLHNDKFVKCAIPTGPTGCKVFVRQLIAIFTPIFTMVIILHAAQCFGADLCSQVFAKSSEIDPDRLSEDSGSSYRYLRSLTMRKSFESSVRRRLQSDVVLETATQGDVTVNLYFTGNNGGRSVRVLEADNTESELINSGDLKRNQTLLLTNLMISLDGNFLSVSATENGNIDVQNLIIFDLHSRMKIVEIENVSSNYGIGWASKTELIYTKGGNDLTQSWVFDALSHKKSIFLNRAAWFFSSSDEELLFLGGGSSTLQIYMKRMRIWLNVTLETGRVGYQGDYIGKAADRHFILLNGSKGHGELHAVRLQNNSTSETIIKEKKAILKSASISNSRILSVYEYGGKQTIHIYSLNGKSLGQIAIPDGTYFNSGKIIDNQTVELSLSTFVHRNTKVLYNLESKRFLDSRKMSSLFFNDGVRFQSQYIEFPSQDGTLIPVKITLRADLELNHQNPTLISVYGGFGRSNPHLDSKYDEEVKEFLMKGGIHVAPALRGGMEYGSDWHLKAVQNNKQKTILDLIATTEYLINNGYSKPSKIAVRGASCGGLVAVAAGIQRPDLFQLIEAQNGVMDLLHIKELDPHYYKGWEYDFGSSDNPNQIESLRHLSPLENVRAQHYPSFHFIVGADDSRVNPLHSIRMYQILKAGQLGPNPILLSTFKNTGHFLNLVRSQREIAWRSIVSSWSLIYDELGMNSNDQASPTQ
jgi:prolyl oligopeptidase PreP (S9A serine peptidase family)